MARKPKHGTIYQRGKIWWIKYYKEGEPFYESSKSTRYDDADRLLRKRQGEIVTGRFKGLAPERIRLNELFDDVVADYKENGKRSLADVVQRLKSHIRPALGELRAAEFGSSQLRRYKAQRQREEAANATINRELAIIKRAFSLAADHDPPKVAYVPRVAMLDENNIRTGFLERDQYERLLGELPDYLKPVLVIGYHTGARLGELMALQWSQVDFAAKNITLHPGTTKNGEGRYLPIYGEMFPTLQRHREWRDSKFPDCQYVFHDGSGKRLLTFYKAWRSACDRAKLKGQLFHDLRRSAVRNMVRAGIPETVARRISGHKSRHVFERYDIISEADISMAGEMMERFFAAARG